MLAGAESWKIRAVPEFLHESAVFASPIVSIADIRCRPTDRGCGEEEFTGAASLAFVRSGVFCKHVGRDELIADSNHLVFFNAGEPYRVSHPVDGGDECTSLRFAAGALTDALAVFDPSVAERPRRPFPAPSCLSSARSAILLHRIRKIAKAARADRLGLDETCLELLAEVVNIAHARQGSKPLAVRSDTRRAHRRFVDQTRLLLAEKHARPLSLADIAAAVGCSAYHLVRIFRRETGLPVHRYLTGLRLRAALERIDQGCQDLTRLALDLGFASHSHFTDSFRREFGQSPSSLRDRS